MPAEKIPRKNTSAKKKGLKKPPRSRSSQSPTNQTPALRPTMLLVLGMHRSGTSVTSRLLECLGAVNSTNLMPAHADNPNGYFEDHDVYQFNETKLLPCLGIKWFNIGSVDWAALTSKNRSKLTLEALEIIRKNYSVSNPLSVIKEPRIGILLPFWIPVLERAGYNVKIVCSVRDPLSVARSLGKRNGMSINHGGTLYLTYWLSILRGIQNLPVAFLQFNDLFGNSTGCLDEVARKLGIPLPEGYETGLNTFATSFLDGSLRHSRIETKDLSLESDLPPLTIELHQVIEAATIAQNVKKTSRFISKANKIFHQLEPILGDYDSVYSEAVRVKQLKADHEKLTAVHAKARSTSQNLESALERESLLRGQIAEKITYCEQNKERLKHALADTQSRVQQLQKELGEKDTQFQALFKEKETLISQVESLSAAEAKANSTSRNLESALERESLLRGRIAEKTTYCEQNKEQLKHALADTQSRVQQLQKELGEKDTQFQALFKEKETLVSQVESLSAAEAKANSISRNLESALERESLPSGQLAEKTAHIEEDKKRAEAALAEALSHAENLQQQLVKQAETFQANVDERFEESAKLSQLLLDSVKDKEALTTQVESLQANVDERFEELAKLSQLLSVNKGSYLFRKLRSTGKLLLPSKS